MRAIVVGSAAIFLGLFFIAMAILMRSTEFESCFSEARNLFEEANPDGDDLKIRLRAIQVCNGDIQRGN